jgi:hypothetical protein
MSLGAIMRGQQRGEVLLPVLKKFLLQEADALAAGKTNRHDIEIRDAEMTVECFIARKKVREAEHHPEGEYFHPSSLGQCIRKLWFQEKKAPQNEGGMQTADDLLRWHLILETGTYVHVMIQNLCAKAGVLLKREIPIINKEHKIIGTADGKLFINGKKYLLEIKTINPRDYARLSQAELGHRRQAHAYMKCLGLTAAVILYFNKGGDSKFKEFVVPFVNDRIEWHYRNVRTNTLPPREGVNPRLMPCLYCQFTHVCFGSLELAQFMKRFRPKIRLKTKLVKKIEKWEEEYAG